MIFSYSLSLALTADPRGAGRPNPHANPTPAAATPQDEATRAESPSPPLPSPLPHRENEATRARQPPRAHGQQASAPVNRTPPPHPGCQAAPGAPAHSSSSVGRPWERRITQATYPSLFFFSLLLSSCVYLVVQTFFLYSPDIVYF